jgi:hypothetical protein
MAKSTTNTKSTASATSTSKGKSPTASGGVATTKGSSKLILLLVNPV